MQATTKKQYVKTWDNHIAELIFMVSDACDVDHSCHMKYAKIKTALEEMVRVAANGLNIPEE